MAERFNAAVLKTVVLHGTGGSNPSLSAKQKPNRKVGFSGIQLLKVYFQKAGNQKNRQAKHERLLLWPPPNGINAVNPSAIISGVSLSDSKQTVAKRVFTLDLPPTG